MTNPIRLYIGTIGEGLWISSDGGRSFSRTYEGLFVECHVRAIKVHPRDDRTLYLGTELGLFRSTDAGAHWQPLGSELAGKQVWSILLSPNDPNLLVVGTCPSRLFRSEDGGKSWHEPRVAMQTECPRIMWTRVTSLLADPVDRDTLYAGVEIDGLKRSRDGGLNWESLGAGLSSQDIHDLAMVPVGQAFLPAHVQLLAGTNNDLNRSSDQGQTWAPLGLGKKLPYAYFRGIAQKVDDPKTLLLGNGDGPPGTVGTVARSTDGGHTWQSAKLGDTGQPGVANSTIWCFATHPADPNLIFCNSVSGEVYRSTDAGGSWEKLPREFGEIRSLAWTPG